MLIDLFEETEEDESEFVSFFVFEPTSLRVPDNDILLIGDSVVNLFNQVNQNSKNHDSLSIQILNNRLKRIEMMLDLLKNADGLIMTKFLNKIWRRYAFFSNLGEFFITKGELDQFAPNIIKKDFILDRSVGSLEDLIEEESKEDSEENSEDGSKDNSEKSSEKASEEVKNTAKEK
jgi:hypothetical protein